MTQITYFLFRITYLFTIHWVTNTVESQMKSYSLLLIKLLIKLPVNALIISLIAGVVSGATTFEQVRQWYEWGDYSRIIQFAPELFSDTSQSLDSSECALLHMYLGVAYFVEAEVNKARNEFNHCLQAAPDLSLDSNYVSGDIYEFFEAMKLDKLHRDSQQKKNDLLIRQSEKINRERVAILDTLDFTVKNTRKRGLLFSAFASSALAAGCAGIAVYEYFIGEKEYETFLSAAQNGDFVAYKDSKEKIHTSDVRMVVASSGAGISAIAGALLFISVRRSALDKKNAVKTAFISIGLNEIKVSFTF